MMLELKNVHTHYGRVYALKGINISVKEGEIVALIGSNGAGKSTTLLNIMGLVKVSSGDIYFKGQNLLHKETHDIVKMGVGLSPEGREVFPNLSVEENLRTGAFTRKDKAEIEITYKQVYGLFPRLEERKKQAAGTLSGGEQQMLAIGRALMSKPKLLLLDEPSLGLAPNLVSMIFDLIKRINQNGVTVLLVEQNAHMALRVANRGYVLENGNIVLTDTATNLLGNDDVRRAYLGQVNKKALVRMEKTIDRKTS